MNKQALIDNLKGIIEAKFSGNVSAFAKICGIHSPTIHNYLKGLYSPKGDNLEKIAQAAGISIAELCGEKPESSPVNGEIIPYMGPERRRGWPYSQEELEYTNKLVAILKGKNKKNAQAIKQNIDAFYETRDVEIPLEAKKAEGA